ncbi:hypothetical protein HKCCSP123_13035, partial [Rhodobacterales bacterium HKCCSP123]|nr:hypothetical protein [Rhodobacterales bacterium HKCCSP123]
AGNDTLRGGAENDRLFGGAGSDTIDGGAGDDTLFGGLDIDTFVFGTGHGIDVIRDFDANGDIIDLTLQLMNFSGLIITDEVAGPVVAGVGAGALVITAGGSILLEGVSAADLSEDDFLFAIPG